ncbi:MAG: SusC/RagA family TonB-linked outer membrane protein [Fermentimonas sp.]
MKMKIKLLTSNRFIKNNTLKELFRVMRITLILLFVLSFQLVAENVKGQDVIVKLKTNKVSVRQLINEIENQTGYLVVYSNREVNTSHVVNLKSKAGKVLEYLNKAFDDTDIGYDFENKYIILAKKDSENNALDILSAKAIQQTGKTITGKVVDANGEPIIGATIIVKGDATKGTVTDVSGNYTLTNISENNMLVFSFVGMKNQELSVSGQTTINVTMEEDAIGLQEVVAIGYGTQKKVNLTGAVSSINADELIKRPSYSTATLLQGKIPGLQVIQQSGEPGNQKLKINIRGKGTFSGAGSEPLVVIDGIAYPSWTSIDNLNPENIESISVLKDAASASIYGARAANGVIIVTTKKGILGKPQITYHGNFGFQTATFVPKFIVNSAEYMEMYNYTVDRQGTGTKFPAELIEAYKNAPPNDPQYPNFDWRDAILNPGWGNKHNLSVTGGNEQTKYYIDAGYYSQDAIIRGQSYSRYTAQINIDTKITDWLSFGTNINGLIGKRLGPAMTSQELMMFIYDMNPTTSPKLPDGRWSVGSVCQPFRPSNNIWRLTDTGGEGGTRLNENHNVSMSGFLNVNLTPEIVWNLTGSYNYDANFEMVHQITPEDENEYYFQTGEFSRVYYNYHPGVSNENIRSVMPSIHSTLSFTKSFFESHNVHTLIGYDQEYFQRRNLFGHRRDYAFRNLPEINAGDPSVQTLSGSSFEWAIQSFFGRLTYDYKGKYLIEANARYDGTSRIHKDNRWGFFPSFSTGWRISEESFLKPVSWLENLKLRVSWGQLGNQNIGTYPYQSLLNTTTYAQGGGVEQGVTMTSLADPTLKWEVTTISNLGVDFSIKQGLFSFTLDVYNKDTKGILNQATIPLSVGLTAPTINYGSMNNKGFEFVAGHRNKIKDFSYNVDLNFSLNRNKITQLVTPSYGLQANQVGHEFGAHHMLEWIGIFQSQQEIDSSPKHQNNPKPGDLIFKDQNGDGVIDNLDRVILPGRYPRFIYGGNIGINWKNFDLSMFLQGVYGTKHYITRRGEWPFLRMAPPTEDWRNAWTPDNPTNKMPALYRWPYAPVSGNQNSYFLKDTSYFRLKNLQVGFSLPKQFIEKIGIQNLRIYASGDNLITFTSYKHSDPERDEDIHYGFETEAGSYPNVQTITFGLVVNM